jgi:hypothetical protein
MPLCTICGEDVEFVTKCEDCGEKFCASCGDFEDKLCDYCYDEDTVDEDEDWDYEDEDWPQKSYVK